MFIDCHNVEFCDGSRPYYRDFAREILHDRSHEILARATMIYVCSLVTALRNCVQRGLSNAAAALACRSNGRECGSACGKTVHSLFETASRVGGEGSGGQGTVEDAWSVEVSWGNQAPHEDYVSHGRWGHVKICVSVQTDGVAVLTLFFVVVEQP